MSPGADVVAAGAVITRKGGREVLLVHRPKYDDWSFPKGKQDPGEAITATAVREIFEETGLHVHLGRPLPPQHYEIRAGKSKVVNYWVARCDRSVDQPPFVPNSEVDELGWFPVADAARRLSYLDDCEVLDTFRSEPKRTAALIIVRHATALKRAQWKRPDPERPLCREGRAQAIALMPVLSAFGVREVHTSPSERCLQTVLPYAQAHQLEVQAHPCISEEDEDTTATAELLDRLLSSRTSAAVCSHRPVLPDIFEHLGVSEEPLARAELVVFHHRGGRIRAAERHLS